MSDERPSADVTPPRPRRRRTGVRRLLPTPRGLLLALLLTLAAALAGLGVAFAAVPIPDPNEESLAQKTIVYFSDGRRAIGEFGTNRTNVPLRRVPEHVRHAVLAAEDRGFYRNRGISPRGVVRAAIHNLRGDGTQGGSTITQQYVKNSRLTAERTLTRKAREFVLALKIDARQSKDEILENYLNTIYWGRSAYGIQAASTAYFGKDVKNLTIAEGAYLAAIIRAPGRYDPVKNRAEATARWAYLLDAMVEQGWLSSAQRTSQVFPRVRRASRAQRLGGTNGYLLTTVRSELESRGFTDAEIETGGLRVVSTFDQKAQQAAVGAMTRRFPRSDVKGVHAGLAAVRPGDGAVVAMYGGPDYLRQEFNDATQARKQGGSTFKAFTLAAALGEGIGLRTRWQGNSPLAVPGSSATVRNEFDEDYGRPDLLEATARSINTAFVDLTLTVTPARVVSAIEAAGLDRRRARGLEPVPTVTLGTAAVSPVDLANAYGTLAAQGRRSSWYTVSAVRDFSGAGLYKAERQVTAALRDDVVSDVTHALRQVIESPRGTGEVARALGRPAAGKTGTHEDKTAWFVGFTPQLSAAVGFYREDGRGREISLDGVGGMSTFFGGGYPARIWTAFMRGALTGEKVLDFAPPAGIGDADLPASPPPCPIRPTAAPSTPPPRPAPAPSPARSRRAETPTVRPPVSGTPRPSAAPTPETGSASAGPEAAPRVASPW